MKLIIIWIVAVAVSTFGVNLLLDKINKRKVEEQKNLKRKAWVNIGTGEFEKVGNLEQSQFADLPVLSMRGSWRLAQWNELNTDVLKNMMSEEYSQTL